MIDNGHRARAARGGGWSYLLRDAYAIVAAVFVLATVLGMVPVEGTGADAISYYGKDPFAPYGVAEYGHVGGYNYAPVFAQIVAPLSLLPWQPYLAVVAAVNLAALYWLLGRWALPALFLPPVWTELLAGNINLLLACAIAVGVRHPASWSFVLLTKITPGVGVLWFAVRREWRSLGIALGATAGVAILSFVVAPSAWLDWPEFLAGSAATPLTDLQRQYAFPVPFAVRLPMAGLLVVFAARTDRAWFLPVAGALALPVLWMAHWTIAFGALRLRRATEVRREHAELDVRAAAVVAP